MDEDRLIDLETKLAYQEETLRVLNDVVTRQQLQLENLQLTCRQMIERLSKMGEGEGAFKGSLADEVPPHY
jgi:SlyX protein